MSFRNFIAVLTFALLSTASLTAREWGAEVSAGGSPTGYYEEKVEQLAIGGARSKTSGQRSSLSFTAKLYYEWIGLRFWSDSYFSGTGKQNLEYQIPGPGNTYSKQSAENEGVAFASAQTQRVELQLRKFYYGHREIFSFNIGLLYRSLTASQSTQVGTFGSESLLTRYATAGLSVEPMLTHFGKMELSLPIDASVGFKFPEGGLFDKGGFGALFFGAGLRLGFEPRGAFATAQAILNLHETPYYTRNVNHSFSQLEVTMRFMVGYHFKTPVYHE
jgi:hypothetical protein